MAKASANPDDFRMSFGDHLDELRSRLLRAVVGLLVVAAVILLFFGQSIIAWLVEPLNHAQIRHGLPPQTITGKPIGAFAIYIKVSLLTGLVLTAPWILYQVWKFIEAGLYQHERKVVYILAPFSGIMAMLAVLFMYYIMLPICMIFFLGFSVSFPQPGGQGSTFIDTLAGWMEPFTGGGSKVEIDNSPDPDEDAKLKDAPAKDAPAKDATKSNGDPTTPTVGAIDPPKAAPKRVTIATLPQLDADPVRPKQGQVWINTKQNALKVVVGERILVTYLAVASVVSPLIDLGEYISFVLWITLGMIVAFQMPVVLLIGAWVGILNPYSLAKARKYVVFACFCVGAVLTPADPISMFVLALPLWFLFELSLIVMRIIYRKRGGDDDEGDGDDGENGDDGKPTEGEPAPA